MSYLEQLHSQRTERLQRMKAWTENRAIVPANLVRHPKPTPAPVAPNPEPDKPKIGRPYWFWMVIEPEREHPPIKAIQRAVADHYGMEVDDLLSSRRTARLITPRHVAIYLSKKLTLRSLPAIGRQFAGRDHTTVLHAVRKVEKMMERDVGLAADVQRLKISLMRIEKPVQ